MLYLQDLLPQGKSITIEYRCNSPVEDEEDMLFGHASWNGEELLSLDGDNYYLRDIVEKYKWDADTFLIIWIKVVWSGGKESET